MIDESHKPSEDVLECAVVRISGLQPVFDDLQL